jgi:type II secretory pathway component PulJ
MTDDSRIQPSRFRAGFTLLEVTLALSVAVFLLGGLYVAVEVQLRHARAGRDIVEQATLARSLLARLDADVSAVATLIDPERFRTQNSSSGAGTGSGQSAGAGSLPGSSNASSGSTTASGGTGSTPSSSSSNGSSVSGDAITLPLSVQGDSTTLHLFIARLPREAMPLNPNATPQLASDLRRVSWWMASGGLARQESPVATSDDALSDLPPGIPDEDSHVLASEVKSVQFQYFDGSSWQDSWDCTSPGDDGVTPIGPPQAVAVTIDIATPQNGVKDEDVQPKRYRHVMACATANGTTAQQTNTGGTGQ